MRYVCACDSNLSLVARLVCAHVTNLPVNVFLQVYSFFSYKYSGCAEINSARIGCLQTEVPPHANTLVFRRWRNCLTVSVISSAVSESPFRIAKEPLPCAGNAFSG